MSLDSTRTIAINGAPDVGADMESVLRFLVKDFGSSPLANGRRMRELVGLNPDGFLRAAITLLCTEIDRRGCRYLLTLLGTQDMLLLVLSDERLPLAHAVVAAQIAAEVDPQLHIRITRYLIATTLDQQSIPESQATRLLDILGEINDSTSLQPFVRQMLLHPSARIRSKLSLLIRRSQSGNRSLTTLLSDADARVRANAVEALWHNANPDICAIVRGALDDTNNRVVGNAILGLYFAGHTSSITAAIKLTMHSNILFRATAAWAMGKTGDPRFLPLLGRMLADSGGTLRKTVFGSIASIKQARSARTSTPPLRVALLDVAENANGKTRVSAAILAVAPAQNFDVPATSFAIELGGVLITDYSCSVRASELTFVSLSLPYTADLGNEECVLLEHAVKSCLAAKGISDQWAIAKYANENRSIASDERTVPITLFGQSMNPSASNGERSEKISYTANSTELTRILESESTRFESHSSLQASLGELIASAPSGSGAKHVVAIIPAPKLIGEDVLQQLIHAAKSSRISLHAICLRPAPEYLQLCRATQGFYRETDSFRNLRQELEIIYAGLTKAYLLDFDSVAGASHCEKPLTLHVNLPSLTGKGLWFAPGTQPEIPHAEVA